MKFTGERFIPNLSLDKDLEIEHLQRYYSIIDLVKGKVVLDAACGEGYGSAVLAEYADQVYGIDISEEAITHAKKTYKRHNLKFIQGSIESLPLSSNSIDVVVSFETVEHVNEQIQKKFLEEVKRVLKEDGILVISTPDKYVYSDLPNYKNEYHVKEFYRDEFKDFLTNYFDYVQFYYQSFQVASIINKAKSKSLNIIYLDGKQNNSGKYIIGLCSNSELKLKNIDSVVLDYENRYQQLLNRIIDLQYHVEEKNSHIQILQEDIKRKEEIIVSYKNKKDELEEIITYKDEELQKVDDELQQKNQVILNQQGHIEQLLEQERKLNNILQSRGWKLLQKMYRFENAVIPVNSKRRLIAKIAYRTARNPIRILRNINLHKLKQFFYYLLREDNETLNRKWEQFLSIYSPEEVKIKVFSPLNTGKKVDFETLTFEKVEKPLVSIIIPVYNQWHFTYSCLLSILENTEDIAYEVIIADDFSSDDTKRISNYVENITVIRNETNLGFLRNCNNAAKYARGKYILFLNNDTNVQKDWLMHLVHLIEDDETIGMIGPKLVYKDGRLQEAGGIIWKDASGWNYGRLDDQEKPEYNYVKEVDYISGACIMIRACLWDEIGGFDERFAPAYYEDTDLAFQVRKHGYKVVYQPKSVVVHFEGISHGTDVGSGIKSYQVKNKEKFIEKWKDVLEKDHFENGQDVFLARDRSKGKKTILVIDHYVPHYDKDAGGRCTYQYLKLFSEMGLNVKFIGDNFFRHEPYTSDLQQHGIEVIYGIWYAKNIEKWLRENGRHLNYVYLNRPHISIKYIDLIKKWTNAKVIYFGHDLHYLREFRQYQVEKKEELLKSSERWKEIEFNLFNKADVIHVVGCFEQEILMREFPDKPVRNIPLFIYNDTDLKKKKLKNFDEREGLLFVGGFNHKPNYDGVLWFVKSIFPLVEKQLPDVKFYIVGSNPPSDIKNLQSENIVVTGFVSDKELENYYNNCKLVVVPLRYGAGVKGKVVEALYHQIPVITTSIGAEGLQEAEYCMCICDDEKKFAKNIVELYNDVDLWKCLSEKSGAYIARNFSKNRALEQVLLEIKL